MDSSISLKEEKTIRVKEEKVELNIRFVIRKDISPKARLDTVEIQKKKEICIHICDEYNFFNLKFERKEFEFLIWSINIYNH